MIGSISITGIKLDVDEKTRKYVEKKIGKLDRYLPRHARKSVSAEVKLTQIDQKYGNKYEAEVLLNVPDKLLTAKDSTTNVLAALDIVEAKLVSQLHKYKQQHVAHIGKRGLMAQFKQSFAREQQ